MFLVCFLYKIHFRLTVRSSKNNFLIKTQLCKLRACDTLIARVTCVSTLVKDAVREFPADARVNRTKTFSLVLPTETV